jgi:hypothetical protein
MYDITAFLAWLFFSPPDVFEAPPAFIFLLYMWVSTWEFKMESWHFM